jgi:hypothetical protein
MKWPDLARHPDRAVAHVGATGFRDRVVVVVNINVMVEVESHGLGDIA